MPVDGVKSTSTPPARATTAATVSVAFSPSANAAGCPCPSLTRPAKTGARYVETPAARRPGLGHAAPGEPDRGQADRQVDQEDPPPAEVLGEQAAGERPGRAAAPFTAPLTPNATPRSRPA